MTGFRNVMLSGRAGYVKQLVREAREEFKKFGELQLFNNEAEEIFADQGPFLSGPSSEPAGCRHPRLHAGPSLR